MQDRVGLRRNRRPATDLRNVVRNVRIESHDATSVAHYAAHVCAAVAFDAIRRMRRIAATGAFISRGSHCLSNLHFSLEGSSGGSNVPAEDKGESVHIEMTIVKLKFGESLDARFGTSCGRSDIVVGVAR